MLTRLPAIALVVMLLGQPAAPAPGELRFNWPAGLMARVETERTRERNTGTPTSSTTSVTYRMRVSPHAEGLSIRYDQFRIDGLPGEKTSQLSDLLEGLVPDMVVSPGGELRRLENTDSLTAAVRELAVPLEKQENAMSPALKDLLAQLQTEEGLRRLAGQEWNALVGSWVDLPLTGDEITVQMEEPSPFWPDVMVPMEVTLVMGDRTECYRGGVPRSCATFEMISIVDRDAMAGLLERLMRGTQGTQGVVFERFDVTTVLRILLEIDTMVPHELSIRRTIEMDAKQPEEELTRLKQTERRVSRFTYPAG